MNFNAHSVEELRHGLQVMGHFCQLKMKLEDHLTGATQPFKLHSPLERNPNGCTLSAVTRLVRGLSNYREQQEKHSHISATTIPGEDSAQTWNVFCNRHLCSVEMPH